MSEEPIDITTHTHSHFEERILKLEERVVRMEKFHKAQEDFYGVVRERTMLNELMSKLESNVDYVKDSDLYGEYPEDGFHTGYGLRRNIE